MKAFLFLFWVVAHHSHALTIRDCPPNLIRVWTQAVGTSCVPRMAPALPPVEGCFGPLVGMPINPFSQFPAPLYQPSPQPWWAYQGNLYYPNLYYPGPWVWPGIQQNYYPGQGQVFAAKPNVYVDSLGKEKKFTFEFLLGSPSFLATTPYLDKKKPVWSGKIAERDKFLVDDISYDYLFYDIRLPRDKMQFENGLCATRENAIQWMLKDLREMNYSALAIQDFEEHWRVKIPDYPFYCIYPQYNRQLDAALPVEILVDQHIFYRSLFVLIPHQKEPDIEQPHQTPLPSRDPAEFRPVTQIRREVELREWGVAFLGY